jgi:hypothetical protein
MVRNSGAPSCNDHMLSRKIRKPFPERAWLLSPSILSTFGEASRQGAGRSAHLCLVNMMSMPVVIYCIMISKCYSTATRFTPCDLKKITHFTTLINQWWPFSRGFVLVTTKISCSGWVRTTSSHAGQTKGCVVADFWQNEPDVL